MKIILFLLLFLNTFNVLSQKIEFEKDNLQALNVFMTLEKLDKKTGG